MFGWSQYVESSAISSIDRIDNNHYVFNMVILLTISFNYQCAPLV